MKSTAGWDAYSEGMTMRDLVLLAGLVVVLADGLYHEVEHLLLG